MTILLGEITNELAKRVKEKYPHLDIKTLQQRGKGKGDAVRQGFATASGEIFMILDELEVCDRKLASGCFKFRVCMVLMKISMILVEFWSITRSKLAKTGSEKIKKFYSGSCRYLAVPSIFFPDHRHWIELVSSVIAQS